MNQPQTGVYAEPNLHGMTMLLNVMTDDVEVMQRKVARIPQLLDELERRFSEAMLNGFVAIGSDYWDILYPSVRPLQLGGFPDCSDGDRQTPRESADLLISIRSDRYDVNYLAGRTLLEWLGYDVEVIEQITSFRYLDGRDLFGFIEAPDNPRGIRRRDVAVIQDDPVFQGGSYLFTQKFRYDLRRWEQLSVTIQEHVMGRKKVSGERISEATLSLVTHAQKNRLLDANEQPLELLRQNMPWGNLREQGQFAMYLSHQPQHVVQWLRTRYQADDQGDYDPLLDYMEAVANAAYFVPAIEFLQRR
ncbi:putative iron-dependent peroxidase [Pseudidiomarina indica]|uniref:Putative iron-dependent peroxidase n=1 Tax=Pseudidiomarina indica TaxID=1159017 RepID=A0A1G6BD95_9GAMM|nr:Dyp-type peroxidase [Pseudidiomarina indica]SDB18584.1 putative iron-dependent peroxidase [Pseudidiomarina indica]